VISSTSTNNFFNGSYSAVKEFLLAIDSYFQIIITPAKVVSAYAVAALKKLKLLNLIVNGTAFDVPK
jgi:hypothetical protein